MVLIYPLEDKRDSGHSKKNLYFGFARRSSGGHLDIANRTAL
jgi:hypothetical protein